MSRTAANSTHRTITEADFYDAVLAAILQRNAVVELGPGMLDALGVACYQIFDWLEQEAGGLLGFVLVPNASRDREADWLVTRLRYWTKAGAIKFWADERIERDPSPGFDWWLSAMYRLPVNMDRWRTAVGQAALT